MIFRLVLLKLGLNGYLTNKGHFTAMRNYRVRPEYNILIFSHIKTVYQNKLILQYVVLRIKNSTDTLQKIAFTAYQSMVMASFSRYSFGSELYSQNITPPIFLASTYLHFFFTDHSSS